MGWGQAGSVPSGILADLGPPSLHSAKRSWPLTDSRRTQLGPSDCPPHRSDRVRLRPLATLRCSLSLVSGGARARVATASPRDAPPGQSLLAEARGCVPGWRDAQHVSPQVSGVGMGAHCERTPGLAWTLPHKLRTFADFVNPSAVVNPSGVQQPC